ncbi:MAG: inositol monophosphatase [Bdellovibrionaceae bacterium]|nr:inositol monophosphatase [Pseudobdellovibrionaceae bacterium]
MEWRSNKILEDMVEAATLGQSLLQSFFGCIKQVEKKEKAGWVTEADRHIEEEIKRFLRQKGYSFSLLGEESFQAHHLSWFEGDDPFWILDPIDGTTNFIHQFPVVAISLALFHKGVVECAVVCAPLMGQNGEVYTAVRGGGAFVNGERMKVSNTQSTSLAFLATGFFNEDENQLDHQLKIFSSLVREARGIRRAGSAAYDLALVARGVFDGFWESGLKPWDTAAGVLLVREAGGVVVTYHGKEYHPTDLSLVAGNPVLVRELSHKIQNILSI